jgi:hypothetical protein
MKKHVVVVLALLALIASAQLLAQEPARAPAAPPPAAAVQSPDQVAPLLESPSCEQPEVPSDLPSALRLGSSCSSNSDCPSTQLCCNLCGNPPDDGSSCLACVRPVRGRCPLVV